MTKRTYFYVLYVCSRTVRHQSLKFMVLTFSEQNSTENRQQTINITTYDTIFLFVHSLLIIIIPQIIFISIKNQVFFYLRFIKYIKITLSIKTIKINY